MNIIFSSFVFFFFFHFRIIDFTMVKEPNAHDSSANKKKSNTTKWAHIAPYTKYIRAFHLCIAITENSGKWCGNKEIFQIKERIVSHVKIIQLCEQWTLNTKMDVSKEQTAQSSSFNNNDNDERWRIETFRIFNIKRSTTQFKSSFKHTKFHFLFVLLYIFRIGGTCIESEWNWNF